MEKYFGIYNDEKGITIRPKKDGAAFDFSLDVTKGKRSKIFAVGESSQFYWWKVEPDGRDIYRDITDGLNHEEAGIDRYCLDFSAKKPFNYIKRVYKKVLWEPEAVYIPVVPLLETWKAGLRVKSENLTINEGGFVQMRLEIRLKREGVSRRDVTVPSDKTYIISIPEGTYDYKDLLEEINIPLDTACVCVFIEGRNYTGKCYIEHPELSCGIHNMLPSFAEPISGMTLFDWTGQFISRKELPEFIIKLNGEKIFEGEIFERVHRFAEWEKLLPTHLLKKENKIEFFLISDYHEPLPYTFYELAILEQPDDVIDIVSVSEYAPSGGNARVLIRTSKENTRVKLTSDSDSICSGNEYFFEEKGLHGITVKCLKPDRNVRFTLSSDGFETTGCIENILIKENDNVITGTSDMIYIPQEMEETEEYLMWYIKNGVGNYISLRPCYRWAGTKELKPDVIKYFVRLMNELEIKYALCLDGREVPGLAAQPDDEMLSGEHYLGRQAGEVDGALCYWIERVINNITDEQGEEHMYYTWKENPKYVGIRGHEKALHYSGEKLIVFSRKSVPLVDYSEARKKVINELHEILGKSYPRHTGPACTFKYFAEGGLQWLSAETMYSNMEILLGFLRGVAKDKNMKGFGAHNAVQWSTTPHESIERYKRYRLALYTCYMLGVTDINTEEGLWHLEEGYEHHHRFSKACKAHLKQQSDFYRYVSSHTRSGKFYCPIALIHGRDDGITMFGKNKIWYTFASFGSAEKSWDIANEFYPVTDPGKVLYTYDCPKDRPLGFYSGTPYGNVDIIPAESKQSTFDDYKLLVFMGYNKFTQEDKEKLLKYVEKGGKVLMTRSHLTSTTNIADVRSGNMKFDYCPEIFGENKETKEVCKYNIGKGTVYLFDTNGYPADIESAYRERLRELTNEILAQETVWASCKNDVEFCCYTQENGDKHMYFLAVDWYNASTENRVASLRISDKIYNIDVPYGVLIKVVTNNKVAVWPESEDGEVISVNCNQATVQGKGNVTFCIAKDSVITKHTVDFSDSVLKTINF